MNKNFLLICFGLFFCSLIFAQSVPSIPLIGQDAPSFTANSTKGEIHFPSDFGKSWKILFSHPADFTPVCTSEIIELALMQKEFGELDTRLAVLSTDQIELHQTWLKSMNDLICTNDPGSIIDFPLIDDSNDSISYHYGMISPYVDPRRTIRGVFIIGPDNKVEATFFYPKDVGRNLEEIKRALIALQTAREHAVLTPVNWKPGDEVLLPYPFPYDSYQKSKENEGTYRSLTWYMLFKKLVK